MASLYDVSLSSGYEKVAAPFRGVCVELQDAFPTATSCLTRPSPVPPTTPHLLRIRLVQTGLGYVLSLTHSDVTLRSAGRGARLGPVTVLF